VRVSRGIQVAPPGRSCMPVQHRTCLRKAFQLRPARGRWYAGLSTIIGTTFLIYGRVLLKYHSCQFVYLIVKVATIKKANQQIQKKCLFLYKRLKQMIMDMTTQIKNSLISRIKDSDDMNFLKALQTIFDSSEQSLYQLSPDQNASIASGREDIKNGDYIDNNELMADIKEWLTKK
jgi:hypothetical protein